MLDRKNSTLKYFIFTIKEYFSDEDSRLDNRKFDSILYLLDDYLRIQNDIRKTNNTKLNSAFGALIENIIFYFDKTPLKQSKVFKNDITSMAKLLKSDEDQEKKYNIILSFYKKIKKVNLIEVWSDILLDKISDFADADRVLDCLVSELLYKGYSLEYLNEWWFNNFDKETLATTTKFSSEINKFKNLGIGEKKEYEILIDMQLPEKIEAELINKKSIKINKVSYSLEDRRDEFPKIGKKETVLMTKVLSVDKYKAIEIAIEPIENYIQIYKVIDNAVNEKAVKACKVIDENENYIKEMHNRKNNIRVLSSREKEDIIDFINLRDTIRINSSSLENLVDIENVINILQKSPEFTKENRLLNLWSSMENLVRFYEGNTIIERVLNIVPKLVTMYLLKQKLNQLWDRLLPIVMKKSCTALNDCDRNDGTKKYIREKFFELLFCEQTSSDLYKLTEDNIVTQRGVLEIHNLLKEADWLKKRVALEFDSTIHNLNAIYRLRNNLVHNGGVLSTNMEYYTRRLQMYLNNTLGIIVYHMKRNPEVTITEILYSVDNTYTKFKEDVEKTQNILEKYKKSIDDKNEEMKSQKLSKEEKEDILREIHIKYEKDLIENNIEDVIFPKYLYLL